MSPRSLCILFCKKSWISLLVFRWNNPTYNPSDVTLAGKDATAYWWCFAPFAWHAHSCERMNQSSHRILNISYRNPVVGVSTDGLQ